MARYEMTDSIGPKFWTIEVDGARVRTGRGRVGAEPKEAVKRYRSPGEAARAAERLVAAQEKKGFILVARPTAPPAQPRILEDLAAAITNDPDDLAACSVYSDALQERGEALGEILALHVAALEETDAARKKKLERDLEEARAHPSLLGPAAPHARRLQLGWRGGVLESVRIKTGPPERGVSTASLLAMLFTLPVARFVSRLAFPGFAYVDFSTALADVVAGGGLRTLRALVVEPAGGPGQSSVMKLARLTALAGLRTLALPFARFDARGLTLPVLETCALTSLDYYTGPAPLADAELPRVIRIALPYATQSGIAPLVKHRTWRVLRLHGLAWGGTAESDVERVLAAAPQVDTFELDGVRADALAELSRRWPDRRFLARRAADPD
jgi:uncharacterized protein (TIGR02996 family)